MISINKEENYLILRYDAEMNSANWVLHELDVHGSVRLRNSFTFLQHDIITETDIDPSDDIDSIDFKLGERVGEYYKIEKRILSSTIDVYFYHEIELKINMFIAEKKIPVFEKVNEVLFEDCYIGGSQENNIPISEFERLIQNFPNHYELKKYIGARLSAILRNYFDKVTDAKSKYEKYMSKKISIEGSDLLLQFQDSEITKYEVIRAKLEQMLTNEDQYVEKQWQREVLQILQFLFPKYIRVFEEAPVRDPYKQTNRKLDFILVDSNGHIDIVEIKRPKGNNIITDNVYRDNHIPMRELSGSIMQIEKYIYYLNKWGTKGEEILTKKYQDKLPANMTLKIINPVGIVIMGREQSLNSDQLSDLEVIKRKFKNVVDIITYDDLLKRINLMIQKFS